MEVFDIFKKIFNDNYYRLYMIGSTSRDYLLNREILDYDFATNAKPDEVLKILFNFKTSDVFKKYGIITVKYLDYKIDIATFRSEENYLDSRHPSKITFIEDLNQDSKRRDFTINSIYIDENYSIIDPNGGLKDLKEGIIRMIGDPNIRIKEDPIRILRCIRFSKKYNFKIEDNLKKVINENKKLIKNLNTKKVEEENKKMI